MRSDKDGLCLKNETAKAPRRKLRARRIDFSTTKPVNDRLERNEIR